MTDEHTETHETAQVDDAVAHHDDATHMDVHTTISDDDHGHAEQTLGPIDWNKWAFALVGGFAALVVLAFFMFAVGGLPT